MKKDFNEVDKLYEEWLTQEPGWSWGWIGWSDCYWLFSHSKDPDFSKAEQILKRGLSSVTDVKHRNDINDRLQELNKERTKRSLSIVQSNKE